MENTKYIWHTVWRHFYSKEYGSQYQWKQGTLWPRELKGSSAQRKKNCKDFWSWRLDTKFLHPWGIIEWTLDSLTLSLPYWQGTITVFYYLVLEEVSTGHLALSHSALPYWTIPDTRSINWTQTHFHWYLINLLHTTEIWPVMFWYMSSILDSFAMVKTKTLWVTNGYDHLDSLCLFWYSKEWQYLFDYLHIFWSFPLQSNW